LKGPPHAQILSNRRTFSFAPSDMSAADATASPARPNNDPRPHILRSQVCVAHHAVHVQPANKLDSLSLCDEPPLLTTAYVEMLGWELPSPYMMYAAHFLHREGATWVVRQVVVMDRSQMCKRAGQPVMRAGACCGSWHQRGITSVAD
jgi:hypothetical protein